MVTFNRLTLLKEAITALRVQTVALKHIIVIDNGSTDGTAEWLDEQADLVVKHQANSGGAGGFSSGLRYACNFDTDWMWVMDDDTICHPDALEKLLNGIAPLTASTIGFVCSKCVWTDGQPHYMNLIDIKPFFNNELPFNVYDEHNLLLTEGCSFVSVLINTKAVLQLGLPYKEFYIWGDDQEYTRRITKAGYLGLYHSESIAVHKTPSNYRAYVYNDDIKNLWKHKCGFRNELFMIRKNKGYLHYMFYMLARLIYTGFKILKLRKDHKWAFFKGMYSAVWSSLFFYPKVEMVNKGNNIT